MSDARPVADSVLTVDGADLFHRIEGEGSPAVAFVHGWCSHLGHWDAQARHLAPRHRVLRWDRRGMGASAGAPPADGPLRHAADLAAVLDAGDVDEAVVVGHAGGGPTAVAFAATRPERTRALVMVDTRLHRPAPPATPDT
ncbi:MAG: alpha/beta hydrolase, partial [Acidimicrobiia bacterium]|nr:alpha/beta hydrolase [Acidimicrobiia bacterium]